MPRFIFSAFVSLIRKLAETIAGALFFMFCRLPKTGLKTASLVARSFVSAVEDSSCALANQFYAGYRFFWKYVKFIPFLRNPPLTKGRWGGVRRLESQTDRAILILVQLWLSLRNIIENWFSWLKIKLTRKEKLAPEPLVYKPNLEKPPFESGFKTWIRVAAFIVVTVFLPEQVSWAIDFDWRVLWPNTASAMGLDKPVFTGSSKTLAPEYVKDIYRINIPDTIKKLLLDISSKPISTIQLSPTMSIELKEPLKMSKGRIEQIYNWLKGKPCGIKAFFDYLNMQGAKVEEQDIAVLALAVDILNDVVKPEGNPKIIKTSLFALAKTSEFFNHKLIPVKLSTINYELSTNLTPFIAHFKAEHYVLVTRLSQEKIYFIDEHQEEFLPINKFLKDSSGYALIPTSASLPSGIELIPDAEAKSILGAKRSYKGNYANLSKLFKKPSNTDLYISLGVTALSAGIPAMAGQGWLGAGAEKAFAGSQGFFKDFAAGLATAEISKAATYVGIRNLGMSPGGAQIFGYAAGGAVSGAANAFGNPSNYKWGGTTPTVNGVKVITYPINIWNNSPIIRGTIMGAVKGTAIGGGGLLAYQVTKNTDFYQKHPFIAKQVSSLLGGAAGYMGFVGLSNLAGFDTTFKTTLGQDKDKNDTIYGTPINKFTDKFSIQPSGSDIILTPTTLGSAMRAAWLDMRQEFVYQGASLATEYILSDVMGIDMKYSRALGEGAGSMLSSKLGNQSLTGTLIKGAISGVSSFGLNAIGGEYDKKTGKNKLGFTELQMAGANWLGTALLTSAYGKFGRAKADFGYTFFKQFSEFSTNFLTFNRTSPFYTKGSGGWSEARYLQKMAEWGGYANLAANADYAMKVSGYTSWKKFVKDGRAANLFPSISNSLVRYTASTLHYSAVNNIDEHLITPLYQRIVEGITVTEFGGLTISTQRTKDGKIISSYDSKGNLIDQQVWENGKKVSDLFMLKGKDGQRYMAQTADGQAGYTMYDLNHGIPLQITSGNEKIR
ncbi:MAG: cysteine peptidase family C39 domain-containing protein, partial [Candidatus Omnitrophota bacterium]|nr:cysteine peptidase family C39 domain-containing protein [Candidatus Omnitrophota bacterium]